MSRSLERFRPSDQPLKGSLLDRLIDEDPSAERDQPIERRFEMKALRESVRRDLEMLLNTRCPPETPPRALEQLDRSLCSFGIEDFFAASLTTRAERDALARSLERRIARFEPRLEELEVAALDARDPSERVLRLRIKARFTPQPGLPALVFQTQLDPATKRFSVADGDDG